jgi:hypothetical protein
VFQLNTVNLNILRGGRENRIPDNQGRNLEKNLFQGNHQPAPVPHKNGLGDKVGTVPGILRRGTLGIKGAGKTEE